MKKILYTTGDATAIPSTGKPVILAHACSNRAFGTTGFSQAISARWLLPSLEYANWERKLGDTQIVQVDDRVRVASMMVHRFMAHPHGKRKPVTPAATMDYDALRVCLRAVGNEAILTKANVVMPRLGTGNSGGEWSRIEPIIKEELCDRGVQVTVYEMAK